MSNPNIAEEGKATQFKPGHSGFAGRKKALGRLDSFLAQESNLKKLEVAFDKAMENPILFWKEIIQPNLPKDIRADFAVRFGKIFLGADEDSVNAEMSETDAK